MISRIHAKDLKYREARVEKQVFEILQRTFILDDRKRQEGIEKNGRNRQV